MYGDVNEIYLQFTGALSFFNRSLRRNKQVCMKNNRGVLTFHAVLPTCFPVQSHFKKALETGRTYRQTDGPMEEKVHFYCNKPNFKPFYECVRNGRTDLRTDPLIEMREGI